eukprot:TRINITY_DN11871_c0_g1_i1.p1 TRINITY_DN11871_c0_g1~~TRINITY_DN11871_c0_g1_i1.p1  ORF type:complete len:305 (+),score=62.89 TRINITY_DN11871_c0_g1_i1:39-917(+)
MTDKDSVLEISLHPLVIINISDHYTREKVNKKEDNTRVYGALLGVQKGRHVEIFNSFAFLLHGTDGSRKIDVNYFEEKISQFQKVYEDYELLGWYTTGSVQPGDMEVHQQIMEFNEAPLLLMLDPNPDPNSRELPISILETELRLTDNEPVLEFAKVAYSIETTDAERIAVDHVANASDTSPESMLISYLMNIYKAINMLNSRVATIMKFVEMQKNGTLPMDLRILRRVKALCQMLPVVDSIEFQQDFLNEYNDTLLVTYLATITKTSNTLNDLIDKFNVTYDQHTRHRGLY